MEPLRLGRVPDPLGLGVDETESPGTNLFKSSSEAFQRDVVPRSNPKQPDYSQVAEAKPSGTFKFDLYGGGEPAPSKPGTFKFNLYGEETTPAPAPKPAAEAGDTSRGFSAALGQTPALLKGAVGFAGAAGEKTFGEGGMFTALKKYGLEGYQKGMGEIQARAKETDDVTVAWNKAKEGDLGALVDWAQYGIGYLGGNIVETVGTSVLGSVVGAAMSGPAAPVGAVGGAVAGAAGKEAVKGVTKNLIEGMVAKEAAKLAEKAGVETATDVMVKQATKNVAKEIGSVSALAGSSILKETGGIYGEAEEQAKKEGRELTGGDLSRIFGAGVVAGLSEVVVDKLGLDVAAGKIKIPGGGRVGRAFIGGAAGVGIEGGQELFQTAVERAGAGQALTGEDAMRDYINAFALGGLGGGTVGAISGALRSGKQDADTVRKLLDDAQKEMTSDDGRTELYSAMMNDEKMRPILEANGIQSGDDPRFQSVITKAISTQRLLAELEPLSPEEQAAKRKEREADIQAAFGETASTAVGSNMGANEPLIQRESVTPNEQTKELEGVAQPVSLPGTDQQTGTLAMSGEDLVSAKQGFQVLPAFSTGGEPVANRFVSMSQAETFLFGPINKETGKREGGYTSSVDDMEFQIRQGKRSKETGGGTFYFIEGREKSGQAAKPEVTATAAPATATAATTTDTPPATTQAATAPAAPVTPASGSFDFPIANVRRANGAIGNQGVTESRVFDVLTKVAGMNLKSDMSMREMVDAFKADTQAQQRLRDFTAQNPAVVTALPDGSFDLNDGNHRTFLLNQIGDETVRAVLKNQPATGEPDATQTRQEQQGGQPKREGTGGRLEEGRNNRQQQAKDEAASGQASVGNQPAQSGTKQATVKTEKKTVEQEVKEKQKAKRTKVTKVEEKTEPTKRDEEQKKADETIGKKKVDKQKVIEDWEDNDDGVSPHVAWDSLSEEGKKMWTEAVEDGYNSIMTHDLIVDGEAKNARVERASKVNKPMFRQTRGGKGMSVEAVGTFVDKMVKAWKNVPAINIVQSENDLPPVLQQFITRAEANGKVPGIYWRGEVYLVADSLIDNKDVGITVMHEVAGHFGLRSILGENFGKTMDTIYEGNATVRKLADAMMKKEGLTRQDAVEEVLADMAQSREAPTRDFLVALRQIFAAIRKWARETLGISYMSDNDVREIVANARRFVIEGERTAAVQPAELALARQSGAPTFYSVLERETRGAKQEKAQAKDWKAIISKLPGVKEDEIKWTGVNYWLDLEEQQNRQITKQEVLTFIAANRIYVNEILLTENPDITKLPDNFELPEYRALNAEDMRDKVREIVQDQIVQMPEINTMSDTLTDSEFITQLTDDEAENLVIGQSVNDMTEAELRNYINDYGGGFANFEREFNRRVSRAREGAIKRQLGVMHKTANRVLPGGKEYVELPLFIPTIKPYEEYEEAHYGRHTQGKTIGWLRMNVRKDTLGNDVLFLEEVQSRRASQGRLDGWVNEMRPEVMKAAELRRMQLEIAADLSDFYDLSDDSNQDSVQYMRQKVEYFIDKQLNDLAQKDKQADFDLMNDEEIERYFVGKPLDKMTREELREFITRNNDITIKLDDAEDIEYFNDQRKEYQKVSDKLENLFKSEKFSREELTFINNFAEENESESELVPPAPFVKDTQAWTALLIKRAIAYAQENGIDRIAWTTGEQQNERWNLAQAVSRIEYDPKNEILHAYPINGNKVSIEVGPTHLGEQVGEGVRKQILEQIESKETLKKNKGLAVVEGDGLAIGAIDLRPYYNKTIPSVAKDLIGKKAFGEGKVEVMNIKGTGQQLGFVIPEKLRQIVAEDGLPMFRRKDYEAQYDDLPENVRNIALAKGHYSPPSIGERLEALKPNLWLRVVQGTFDRFRRVRDIDFKAYVMLRMSSATDGAVEGTLHYGQVFYDDGALNIRKGTKGLIEIMRPLGGETDRFLLWLAANRASNLAKEERERFFKPEEIKALQKLNLGTMKNGKSRYAVYAETQRQMNELNKSVLQVAKDTGLIDAAAFKRFSEDIWYVPFYRQMDEDGTLSAANTSSAAVGQYLSKKLKGSERPLNDLMQNVLLNWSHILSASMKNAAANETLKAASSMGGVVSRLTQVDNRFGKDKDGNVVALKYAVKTMENGKEVYHNIEDEFLLASLDAVASIPTYGMWTTMAREFKTTLTRLISLSPTFKINNLIRDSIQSIGLSELSGSPMANVMQGWRAYKDNRAEALVGGALFTLGNAFDGDKASSVKRLINKGVEKADILTTDEKAKAWFKKFQDKYDEVSDASENANRIALYEQLRAKGASHLEAAYAARDLQDFGLQGSWVAIRYASMILPYFNARLQGMYKLGRDGITPTFDVLLGNADESARQKAMKFNVVLGAVTAVGLALYLSQKDDDDWKKREEWDRDSFFWFKIPGTNHIVRVPKPFEMGAVASIVERFTEQMVDSQVEGKVFGARVLAILHDNLAINPIPQIVRPLYDIARNKDGFTDRPIESMGKERLSPEMRVNPNTSGAAVALGKVNAMFAEFASSVTGGAITANNMKISPIQYDYMIRGYLGWLGTVIQTTSTTLASPFKEGESPSKKIDDLFVVGNFVKEVPANQSKYITSFYENSKEIATAMADYRSYLAAGEIDKAQEYLDNKRGLIVLNKLYSNIGDKMSTISKRQQMIEEDTEMSGDEKRVEIDRLAALKIELAKRAEDIRIERKRGE